MIVGIVPVQGLAAHGEVVVGLGESLVLDFPCRSGREEFADFASRHQESAHGIDLGIILSDAVLGEGSYRLDEAELAVRMDVGAESLPAFFQNRVIYAALQQAVTYAPGKAVAEERRRAGLGRREMLGVQKAGMPGAVGGLAGGDRSGHRLEDVFEHSPVLIVLGQVLEG